MEESLHGEYRLSLLDRRLGKTPRRGRGSGIRS
jgi:hypothetical protein